MQLELQNTQLSKHAEKFSSRFTFPRKKEEKKVWSHVWFSVRWLIGISGLAAKTDEKNLETQHEKSKYLCSPLLLRLSIRSVNPSISRFAIRFENPYMFDTLIVRITHRLNRLMQAIIRLCNCITTARIYAKWMMEKSVVNNDVQSTYTSGIRDSAKS